MHTLHTIISSVGFVVLVFSCVSFHLLKKKGGGLKLCVNASTIRKHPNQLKFITKHAAHTTVFRQLHIYLFFRHFLVLCIFNLNCATTQMCVWAWTLGVETKVYCHTGSQTKWAVMCHSRIINDKQGQMPVEKIRRLWSKASRVICQTWCRYCYNLDK